MTGRRYVYALVFAAAAAAAAGCTGSSNDAGGRNPSTPPTSTQESCPDVSGNGEAFAAFATVDFADFIQAFGRQYVVSTTATHISGSFDPKLTRADLGRVVLRSRCSFSALNDETHKRVGEPRDGDTGFLPAGTPIYAVHGYSIHCRLAAEHDGRIHAYLAYRNGTTIPVPRVCALGHLT